MTPRRIAGLDVSTARIGYAAPNGTLHSVSSKFGAKDRVRRLDDLWRQLVRIIEVHPPRPDLIAIEGYSLNSPGRLALIRLGEVGGIVRIMCYELDIPYVEIPPASLKRFATGNGNADKARMIQAAIAAGARGSVNDDEADAFHLRAMARAAHNLDPMTTPHAVDAIANAGVKW